MDRAELIEKMKTTQPMSRKEMNKIIVDSINSNLIDGNSRGHRNLIIVMEELAELAKEISKELRGKGDIVAITEELADVLLGIYYVQDIVNISDDDIQIAMTIKMNRLQSVLCTKGVYE